MISAPTQGDGFYPGLLAFDFYFDLSVKVVTVPPVLHLDISDPSNGDVNRHLLHLLYVRPSLKGCVTSKKTCGLCLKILDQYF